MNANELSYDEVVTRMNANGVPVGLRKIRDVMIEHRGICPPIVYGYRTIRFAAEKVDRVIAKIKARAEKAGRAAAGLAPLDTAAAALNKIPQRQRKAKR